MGLEIPIPEVNVRLLSNQVRCLHDIHLVDVAVPCFEIVKLSSPAVNPTDHCENKPRYGFSFH